MSRYAKAITAVLTALGTWGATAGADGTYSQIELWGLCGVLVTGFAVFQIPNGSSDTDGAGELRMILLVAAAIIVGLFLYFQVLVPHCS